MARAARPDDLLTLKQAATLLGRSVDTLRRWRRERGLRDWRDPADRSAPTLVSRADVIDIAAAVAAERPDLAGVVDAVTWSPDDPLAATPSPASLAPERLPGSASLAIGGPSAVALVAELAADLRGERDRLRAERDAARAEAEQARARVIALEALIAHGRRSALDAERVKLSGASRAKPKKKKR